MGRVILNSSVRGILAPRRRPVRGGAFVAALLVLLAGGTAVNHLRGTPVAAPVPPMDHVFVVVEENTAFSAVVGSSSAPYINSLVAANGLATNYQAVGHPSEPNYLAMTSGDAFLGNSCVVGDGDPSGACVQNVTNIADSVESAGKTWKAYEESMPAPCGLSNSGTYGVRHDPFVYYADIQNNSARCQAHVVPFTALSTDLASAATTPSYAFITPNVCNDGHDCPLTTADSWLQSNLPSVFNSPAWTTQRSMLLLVWDEDDNSSANNQVAMVVMGSPSSRAIGGGFQSGTAYDHYSMLRTTEDALGLPTLNANDAGATPMSSFFASASATPPAPTPAPATGPTPTPIAPATASPVSTTAAPVVPAATPVPAPAAAPSATPVVPAATAGPAPTAAAPATPPMPAATAGPVPIASPVATGPACPVATPGTPASGLAGDVAVGSSDPRLGRLLRQILEGLEQLLQLLTG